MRSTMFDLVNIVRGMTDTQEAQYTIGVQSYWTQDHIQTALDRYRKDIRHEQLYPIDTWPGGGSVHWLEYQSRYRNYEATSGGTAVFEIEDGTGANVGTASYSVDYTRGRVTFTANTQGTVYYLTGRSYDINATAADIWRQKAAHYAAAYDIRTDNHGFTRSQLMKQALQMADMYDQMGEPQVVTLTRSDVIGAGEDD